MNTKQEYLLYCLFFLGLAIAIPYSFIQAVFRLSDTWNKISLALAVTAWIAAIFAGIRWEKFRPNKEVSAISPGLRLLLGLLIALCAAASSLIIAFRWVLGGDCGTPGLH